MILVINASKVDGMSKPYKKMYTLFKDEAVEASLVFAGEQGYANPIPIDFKPGVLNHYRAGDVNISIVVIEVEV